MAHKNTHCTLCGASLLSLIGSVTGTHALCAEKAFEGALEEIVVTARKREETLQDVPMAITVLPASVLEDAGVRGVADFVQLVPNVTFQSGVNMGENRLTIRGVSQIQNGPPPAAIVVDGVLLISPARQFNVEEFDLERIEVLKGPQGALYGRNAIGGAINMTTRQPTSELEMSGLLGFGSGEDYRASAAISGPIVEERLLARASVSWRDREGELRNVTTGRYTDHFEDLSTRLRLLYTPHDDLQFDLKFSYSDTRGRDPTYVALTVDGMPNANEGPIDADTIGNNPREVSDLSAKMNWTTDAGTLSLVAAYLDGEESLFADFDVTAVPILTAYQAYDEQGFSQELRFTSPGERSVRWIVGGYHVKSRLDVATVALADIGFFVDPPAPTGAVDFPLAEVIDRHEFENFAGFGQVEFDLTEALELALALRYDDDQIALGAQERSFSKVQPKISLNYRLSRTSSLYGSYGEGFRSGSFNPSEATIGDPVMRAESAQTLEAGFKSISGDRRMSFDIAAFYTRLENAQQQVLDFATGSNVGLNVDKSTIQGFEVEIAAVLTDGLTLSLGGGMADSKIERFADNPAFAGNKLPRVPDYTINAGFSYETPITAGWGFFLRTDYNRQGEMSWHVDNADVRRALDYLNARLGVRSSDARYAITGWVRNALDDRATQDFQAAEFSGHPFGLDAYSPVIGVTYGVEVAAKF